MFQGASGPPSKAVTILGGGFFNMSRTLSIDKIGPGPDFLGQALALSQPSCGDLGVSLRRSSLQFNIRPWQSLAGQSVATAEAASSSRQPLCACGTLGARKKDPGFASTASDPTAFRVIGLCSDDCGAAVWRGGPLCSALFRHEPHGPYPTGEFARRGHIGFVFTHPAFRHRPPPRHESSYALGRMTSGRLVRSLSFGEVLRMRGARRIVPRGFRQRFF